MSLLQVSWPLLWRQAAHRRHSQHHRGGQTCAGAWHTSSSIPPIPRPGGHQDALRLAITPTHHPRALAHHPCCLWSPVEASGGAAGFKSTDLSSIFSAAENSWIWLRRAYPVNEPVSLHFTSGAKQPPPTCRCLVLRRHHGAVCNPAALAEPVPVTALVGLRTWRVTLRASRTCESRLQAGHCRTACCRHMRRRSEHWCIGPER